MTTEWNAGAFAEELDMLCESHKVAVTVRQAPGGKVVIAVHDERLLVETVRYSFDEPSPPADEPSPPAMQGEREPDVIVGDISEGVEWCREHVGVGPGGRLAWPVQLKAAGTLQSMHGALNVRELHGELGRAFQHGEGVAIWVLRDGSPDVGAQDEGPDPAKGMRNAFEDSLPDRGLFSSTTDAGEISALPQDRRRSSVPLTQAADSIVSADQAKAVILAFGLPVWLRGHARPDSEIVYVERETQIDTAVYVAALRSDTHEVTIWRGAFGVKRDNSEHDTFDRHLPTTMVDERRVGLFIYHLLTEALPTERVGDLISTTHNTAESPDWECRYPLTLDEATRMARGLVR